MTILAPTPERSQHGDIVVEPAGRNNKARVYDQPIYDRWAKKGIIDERQRHAAQRYVEDKEATSGKIQSCLHRLDVIDYGGAGAVQAETVSQAISRVTAVEAYVGPIIRHMLALVLLRGISPEITTQKHKRVAQGMLMVALETLAVAYENTRKID